MPSVGCRFFFNGTVILGHNQSHRLALKPFKKSTYANEHTFNATVVGFEPTTCHFVERLLYQTEVHKLQILYPYSRYRIGNFAYVKLVRRVIAKSLYGLSALQTISASCSYLQGVSSHSPPHYKCFSLFTHSFPSITKDSLLAHGMETSPFC